MQYWPVVDKTVAIDNFDQVIKQLPVAKKYEIMRHATDANTWQKRILNSNGRPPYGCYGRHDRCSHCNCGRKKRAIVSMTRFHLMAAIAAKTGLKPGSKFNPRRRKWKNDSCWSLAMLLLFFLLYPSQTFSTFVGDISKYPWHLSNRHRSWWF